MNREKKLLKNTFIITIGKICTQMVTFLLLPLYTGILSTKEFGIVDLFNTLVSLALPIITLQYEQAVFRELISKRENNEEVDKIITNGILTVTFQCLVYSIVYLLICPIIKNEYKYILLINVIVAIYFSLLQQISRGIGNNKEYSISSFISALSTILFNILFLVFFKMGAIGMLLGTLLGQLIGEVYLFIKLKINNHIKFKTYSKKLTKKLLLYCIPLVPNAISWWIFSVSDRVIVTTILGIDQNGIMAAVLKFSTIYITIYNIFNISWVESITLAIKDDDIENYFNKTLNIVLKLFVSMAMMMIAIIPFVFNILINERYISGYNLIPISIISSFFNVVVGLISAIYVAKKNSKAIANTSMISAIINLTINLLLITRIGLYAAVISTLIAYLVMSIYRVIDVKAKYFKVTIDKKILIYGTIGLIIISIFYYINDLKLNILSVIISITLSLLLNKDSIKVIKIYINKFIKEKVRKNGDIL